MTCCHRLNNKTQQLLLSSWNEPGARESLGHILYDSFRPWWALCFPSFLRLYFYGMIEKVIV